ncbi:metal-dependent hydrolase family protein [Rhodohalobacter sp. 614A]|uniref:metal-dependent hydrolase family protein n=1 Tax=Rhodohalobacter sp. 614A TaxID=2908649 RepID=UPI001F255477|nr:amidohydrolase family protein [Rhodohalobacter sp. 614A]
MHIPVKKLVCSFIFLLAWTGLIKAQEAPLHIFAGKLLDVENGVLLENVLITVDNGLILEIQGDANKASFENIIDLSDYTVLPGLMDVHTHLCDNTYMGADFDHWTYPAATFGIVGTVNAKKTLEAGFTTVRNVSEAFYADVALRDAINSGWIDGPRMYVSGPMITMTGGHGNWGNWIGPQHNVETEADMVADGPDEVRKAVRTHIKHGVNLIKITATGGFGTPESIPGAASYSVEEIQAAVDEAGKRGFKVAAHAHGKEGMLNAVEAGVHSIEHAFFLDEEVITRIKEKDIFLVMDLLSAHYDLIEVDQDYSDKELNSDNENEFKSYTMRFNKAYHAGVRMAFGTDASVYPHGRNAEQFKMMVDAGMSSVDGIRSSTIWAAELIGIEKNAGSIEPGKWADLIAVRGNPLEDISLLENVQFVMKGGKIYKSEK